MVIKHINENQKISNFAASLKNAFNQSISVFAQNIAGEKVTVLVESNQSIEFLLDLVIKINLVSEILSEINRLTIIQVDKSLQVVSENFAKQSTESKTSTEGFKDIIDSTGNALGAFIGAFTWPVALAAGLLVFFYVTRSS